MYPDALEQPVTGGYGPEGAIGTVKYIVADRYLVRWPDGIATWQARWLLSRVA